MQIQISWKLSQIQKMSARKVSGNGSLIQQKCKFGPIPQNSNYQLLVLLQPICTELDFFEEIFSPNKKTQSYKSPLLVKLFDIKGMLYDCKYLVYCVEETRLSGT